MWTKRLKIIQTKRVTVVNKLYIRFKLQGNLELAHYLVLSFW